MDDDIEAHLEALGLPAGDRHDLPASDGRFSDGSAFKLELLPEGFGEYRELFDLAADHGVTVNRVTDTGGTAFDSDERIRKKCAVCRDHGAELLLAPGTGARNDTSQQKALGAMPGGGVRGMDAVVDAAREAERAADLGCRGFVLFDEGVYAVCRRLREAGDLPPETTFKVSSVHAVANPASLAAWTDRLGPRDSLNPVRDLTLPMLAAMRAATNRPLDVHAYWREHVARPLDAPGIVRAAAPVYLKNFRPDASLERRLLDSAALAREIGHAHSDLAQSSAGADDLGIPAAP